MKTLLKNVVILVLSLVLYSCGTDQGAGKTYIYTVQNESGKSIEFRSYISYLPDVAPVITTLGNGQEITKTYEDGLPPSGYDFLIFFGNDRQRDSLVVIYENEKFNNFSQKGCIESDRNPLNTCVYNEIEETFTFTKEDFTNATPCKGNCG